MAASGSASTSASTSAALTACTIRFRLDGPGPAAFLVDCAGELRVYARGGLGGLMPRGRLLALLAERGCRWVPASGSVLVDADEERRAVAAEPPPPAAEWVEVAGAGEAPPC